jgi:predicted permease
MARYSLPGFPRYNYLNTPTRTNSYNSADNVIVTLVIFAVIGLIFAMIVAYGMFLSKKNKKIEEEVDKKIGLNLQGLDSESPKIDTKKENDNEQNKEKINLNGGTVLNAAVR